MESCPKCGFVYAWERDAHTPELCAERQRKDDEMCFPSNRAGKTLTLWAAALGCSVEDLLDALESQLAQPEGGKQSAKGDPKG